MNILAEIKLDLSKNIIYIKSAFKKCPKCGTRSLIPHFHHINNDNMWEAEFFCENCYDIVDGTRK